MRSRRISHQAEQRFMERGDRDATAFEPAARGVVRSCVQVPPQTELLPLLALSVLATRPPFSAAEVGSMAREMAASFEAAENDEAGERLLSACASSLARCGVPELAADLREAQALLRWRTKRRLAG
jgi:hypothetical protein